MLKTALAASLTLAMLTPAQALPLVDLDVGLVNWFVDYDGDLVTSDQGPEDESLGLDDETDSARHAYLEFRHPLPLFPNLRAAWTEASVSSHYDQAVTIAGTPFSADSTLDVDLTHMDIGAFYEPDIPWLAIQAGLNLRLFMGDITATGTAEGSEGDDSTEKTLDLDGVPLPMATLGIRLDIPASRLWLQARGEALAFPGIGSQTVDWSAGLGFALDVLPVMDLKLEAGWRQWDLELDPDDFDSSNVDSSIDLDLSGVYLGIGLAF